MARSALARGEHSAPASPSSNWQYAVAWPAVVSPADLALEVMGCRAIRCQRWIDAGDQRRTQQDFAMRIVGDCRQQPARVSVTRQGGQQQQPATVGDARQNLAAKLSNIEERNS